MSVTYDLQCDCCGKEPGIRAASIPGVPMTIMWGKACIEAGVVPWWAAVANTESYDSSAAWWQDILDATIPYFGKTREEFDAEVEQSHRDIEQHFAAEEASLAEAELDEEF